MKVCLSIVLGVLLVGADRLNSFARAADDVQYSLAQQPTAPPTRTPAPTRPPVPPLSQPDANALALSAPPNRNLSADLASSRPGYSVSSTPNMIGDTLGPRYFFVVESPKGPVTAGNVPLGDGSIKISEDCSPLPVDRVFYDFNHFQNALVSADGGDVSLNRSTFGFEKTFFNGMSSLEIKAPIDSGLDPTQNVNASTFDNEGTLFGSLIITPKVLLFQNDRWAASAGLAIGLPTSPDAALQNRNDTTRVFNEATHLAPFVGILLTPNERWFSITYMQWDFDTGGNRVTIDNIPEGILRDPTLMYVDCSVGYWLFYDQPGCNSGRFITGLAPVIELHYTTTLQDAPEIRNIVQPQSLRFDSLNITGGLFFKIGPSAGLTVGGVAPLRTQASDKEFDAEVLVQFNRWF